MCACMCVRDQGIRVKRHPCISSYMYYTLYGDGNAKEILTYKCSDPRGGCFRRSADYTEIDYHTCKLNVLYI